MKNKKRIKKLEKAVKRLQALGPLIKSDLISIIDLGRVANGHRVEITGVFTRIAFKLSKHRKKTCRLVLSDWSGNLDCLILSNTLAHLDDSDLDTFRKRVVVGTFERDANGKQSLIIDSIKDG